MKEVDTLRDLYSSKKLNSHIFLWGIGKKTEELIIDIRNEVDGLIIEGILDNFKSDFLAEYSGLPVYNPSVIDRYEKNEITVLLAVATSASIWKQLDALGIQSVYNLSNPDDIYSCVRCDYPYTFIDRNKGAEKVVYVLAGYQKELWDTTLKRMFSFMEPGFDYCMISSGKYDEELNGLCEQYGWSYLYSEINQICYLQNLVIEKHPKAQYFVKLDEDMFIGKGFYSGMINGYEEAAKSGEYRVGCAVPVMPLNYNSYITYLDAIGKKKLFEERYGRAYRCTFSAPYSLQEAAIWIWDTVDSIDSMAEFFSKRDDSPRPLCSLYNIGAFLFSRERWIMFGRWPEDPNHSGMGVDESYLFHENMESGMATYEIQNVFVGHFAFSGQKEMMLEYYKNHRDKFTIQGGD